MPTRREILELFTFGLAATTIRQQQQAIHRPLALRPGATVGIIAPASPVHLRQIQSGINFLRSLGLRVEVGRYLSNDKGYLAASDHERATELMEFLLRPDIDAVICARGGYGTMRILPLLDYNALSNCRKPLIGYSDITALLIAIYQRCRLVTFHGPMASSEYDSTTAGSFIATLFQFEQESVPPPQSQLSYSDPSFDSIFEGTAEGTLVGGNLTVLCSLLGTPFELDTRDCILFVEDIGEEPYKVDRMLTHLELAGKFEGLRGLLIGSFAKAASRWSELDTSSAIPLTIRDTFAERCQKYRIPALAGIPFGHIKSKITLPIGVHALLATNQKTITLLEPPIEWRQ